eukprot:GHVL01034667.1.p1 GENE.GHVL01034667.1~~GHVL01034667.1.p1  ORF type:complete len:260 (-),score=53.39 GHVL01034667.1:89-868(-)
MADNQQKSRIVQNFGHQQATNLPPASKSRGQNATSSNELIIQRLGASIAPPSDKPANLPPWAKSNYEIAQLTDLYQQQLAELHAEHSLLLNDQERLAGALAPFIMPNGQIVAPLDSDLILFKQGLDLRLTEFEEDCGRIQQTERRLQRKIEECTINYESQLMEAQGFAESRLLATIKDQQKIIELLTREVDEMRSQRDLYCSETKRLRKVCRYGDWTLDGYGSGYQECVDSPRNLHSWTANQNPPGAASKVRHNKNENI